MRILNGGRLFPHGWVVNIESFIGMTNHRRTYTKRRRAASEAETRLRITEAAVELHGDVGPANTTVSEIARKAGVQRLTVYNHFPDQRSLFTACTTHWFRVHPPPDASRWSDRSEPADRVRSCIEQLYAYYEANERMIANWLRDAQLLPALAEFAETGYYGMLDQLVESALPEAEYARARAALSVALHFETWRTLVKRRGFDVSAAADLMTAECASQLSTGLS